MKLERMDNIMYNHLRSKNIAVVDRCMRIDEGSAHVVPK